MSRKIDITQELSDEDIKYLKSRGREYDIERNKEFVSGERVGLRGQDPQDPTPSEGDEEGDSSTEDDADPSVEEAEELEDTDPEELSYDELKALAKAKGLPVSGSKTDLKERLKGA